MADIRGPDIKELAEKDYMSGMKYKDIAEKYNVSLNTVKSWKQRYKWSREGVHTNEKGCTQNKKNAQTKLNNKKNEKKSVAEEVEEVMENDKLNDSERLFCVIYSRCFNATKAYLKAYTCTYETAMVNGCKLLRKAKIKEQIDSLTQIRLNKEALKRSVIQKYIDIAFSDITDYVTFGQDEIAIRDENGNIQYDEDGNMRTRKYSYVRPNESTMVDGTLISEVSQGKDGIKIKLADKMKALDFLTKHCNLLSDEEKIKLDIENKKLQNIKLKAETENIKGDNKNNATEDWVKAIETIAAKRGNKNE